MRIEIWLLLITGAILFHIYSDGKYFKNIMAYKKYLKIDTGYFLKVCLLFVYI